MCTGVTVELSPSEVAFVCPEQQLSLTCRTNQSPALRWTIIIPHRTDPYEINVFSNIGDDIQLIQLEVAGRSIVLNFLRQSTNALISTLSIDSTVTELNGTRINCSTGDSSVMTVIHIIGRKNNDLRFLLIIIILDIISTVLTILLLSLIPSIVTEKSRLLQRCCLYKLHVFTL